MSQYSAITKTYTHMPLVIVDDKNKPPSVHYSHAFAIPKMTKVVPNSPTGLVSVTGVGWSVLVDANDLTGLVQVIRSGQEPVPDQSV